MKRRKENIIEILFISAISAVIWLIIFIIKGIYPAGDNSLVYSDMGELLVPMYYHLWDFLHGETSLVFSWNIGMGTDLTGLSSEFSLLSPLNIFWLFVKRRDIFSLMGVYTAFKCIASAFSIRFLLKRRYKLPILWICILSLLYEFSPCMLLYYQLSFLIDIAFILPFVVVGYYELMDKSKIYLYTVSLAALIGINIYVGMMVVIFLIVLTMVGNIFEKTNKKAQICLWAVMSVVAAGMSAFLWVPALMRILESGRMQEYSGIRGLIHTYISAICDEDWGFIFKKYLLLNSGMMWIVIVFRMKEEVLRKKSIRGILLNEYGKLLLLLVILLVSSIIPGIELLWHMGTRIAFPVRYIFIVSLVLVMCTASSLQEFENTIWLKTPVQIILVTCVVFSSVLWGIKWIAPTYVDYRRNDFLITANTMDDMSGDKFVRYKEKSGLMQANYSLISKTNSIGQYAHIVPSGRSGITGELGYTVNGHKTVENGGTIFSDLVLGIRGVISPEGVEEYKQQIPIAMMALEENTISKNAFWVQNIYSRAFTNGELDIIEYESMNENDYLKNILEAGELYLWAEDDICDFLIRINDIVIEVPSWNEWGNNYYPASYNNGIISLGKYETGSVKISIVGDNVDLKEIYIGFISDRNLNKVCENINKNNKVDSVRCGNRKIEFNYEGYNSGYIFVPVFYENNWRIKNNYSSVKPKKLMGGYLGIPVQNGSNHIEVEYVPQGICIGIFISIVSIIVFIIVARIPKTKMGNMLDVNFIWYTYKLLSWMFVIFMFVVPIAHFVYMRFIKVWSLINSL